MDTARFYKVIVPILLCLFILFACQSIPSATKLPASTQSPATATLVPTATNSPSITPSATPTSTSTPPLYPILNPQITLDASAFTDPTNNHLHDLIIFLSRSYNPFPEIETPSDEFDLGTGKPFMDYAPVLWFVSPDGTRLGNLKDYLHAFQAFSPLYFPKNSSTEKILAVEMGYYLNNQKYFQAIQLPEECNPGQCRSMQYSPNGEYLGIMYPSQTGCSSGVIIVNTADSQVILRDEQGLSFQFLPNGKILFTSGHCEGGTVNIFDPQTGQESYLGNLLGFLRWNNFRNILLGQRHDYKGAASELWAYNLDSDTVFFHDGGVIETILWTPDQENFIYQKARIISSAEYPQTYSTIQVMIAGPQQPPKPLLDAPNYDYHLCAAFQEGCEWYGDWIKVRRIEASDRTIDVEDGSDDSVCFRYGKNCSHPTELFALNYRTGELIPWEDAILPSPSPVFPTPTPTPISSGPDLTSQPIYTHPSGSFAFYVGLDGHSLWLVPQTGDPVLWVEDGSNFIYIP